jgi:hypothetical protein
MSLNYDLQNVTADYKSDEGWALAHALIWGTMSVGMHSIDEKDWEEFFTRAHIVQTIHGGWLWDKETQKARHVTANEIRSFIGLRTNVTNQTNAQFKNRIDRALRDQAQQMLRMARENA